MKTIFVLAATQQQAVTWWRKEAKPEFQDLFRFATHGAQLLGRGPTGADLVVLPRAERHPRYGEVISIARSQGLRIRWVHE